MEIDLFITKVGQLFQDSEGNTYYLITKDQEMIMLISTDLSEPDLIFCKPEIEVIGDTYYLTQLKTDKKFEKILEETPEFLEYILDSMYLLIAQIKTDIDLEISDTINNSKHRALYMEFLVSALLSSRGLYSGLVEIKKDEPGAAFMSLINLKGK